MAVARQGPSRTGSRSSSTADKNGYVYQSEVPAADAVRWRRVALGLRTELRDRLTAIPCVEIPSTALDQRPNVLLASLDDEGVTRIAEVFSWVVGTIAAEAQARPDR